MNYICKKEERLPNWKPSFGGQNMTKLLLPNSIIDYSIMKIY